MASPRVLVTLDSPVDTRNISSKHFFELYSVTDIILGQGSTCTVKKCIRKADDKILACKIVEKSKLTSFQLCRVRQEIIILEKLQNEDLCINLIHYYESSKQIYIVTDLCDGGDLCDYISDNWQNGGYKAKEKVCRLIFTQLILGIHELHKNGIVHRDIKPENIAFIKKKSYKIKIIDFGLAHIGLKNIKKKCGSPFYVAPEILNKKEYNRKVDWWSCGVLLYGILCGRYPFFAKSKDEKELFKVILKGKYSFKNTNISLNAQDLISKLLIKNPKERIKFCDIMRHPWMKN